MKPGSPHLTIFLAILFAAFLEPSGSLLASDFLSEEGSQIHGKLGFGYGFESNVFYSTNDPQSDSFILTEATVNASLKPSSKSLLFVDFLGNYQHFLRFNEADRIFLDLILDYHYFINPSVGIGLSNTLSYADLKLFDTQGNALPREKFGSLSERVRLYGFFYPSESIYVELGGSYRTVNVEETENAVSMDFQKIAADLSARYTFSPSLSSRLRYEYSLTDYDEFQALNRDTSFDGTVDPNNPALRLARHEISLNLKYGPNAHLDLEITGKLRINEDQFEQELNYLQSEVGGSATVRDWIVTPYIELYFMNRDYANRRNEMGSNEKLKETFFIGSIDLNRNLKDWLEFYLKYQWIHYISNAPSSSFNDHIAMLGLRLIR